MGCDKSVFNENSPNMRHAVSKKRIFPLLYITGPSSQVRSTSVIIQIKQMKNTKKIGYYMSFWKGQLYLR